MGNDNGEACQHTNTTTSTTWTDSGDTRHFTAAVICQNPNCGATVDSDTWTEPKP